MRRLLLLVAVVGLVAQSAASAMAAGTAQDARGTLSLASLVVPGVESLTGPQAEVYALQARRANPAAVLARGLSRSAYEGLGSAGASRLAREAFPGVLAGRADRPLLAAGQRITHYLGMDSASVEPKPGVHAVLESSVPLAASGAGGRRVALNLGLHAVRGGYAPALAAAKLLLGRQASDGVKLSDSGLSIAPVGGAAVGDAAGSAGVLDGSAVFYANTGTDADTLLKPVAQGVQVDGVLRSAASPETLSFVVKGPGRVTLSQLRSGAVRLRLNGSSVAEVAPPSAEDAAGTHVPVSMSVAGDRLVLRVRHRDGDFQYPIEVDPTVTDTLLGETLPENPSAWAFGANGPFFGHDEGTGVNDTSYAAYTVGQWGAWAYETQGVSKIYAFGAETAASNPGSNVENRLLIVGHTGTEAEAVLPDNYGASWNSICTAGCAGGSANNAAEFLQVATASGSESLSNLYRTEVEISQEAAPTVEADTTDVTLEGRTNVAHTGGWLGTLNVYGVTAHDPGIGVDELKFRSPNAPGWEVTESYLAPMEEEVCAGVQCKPELKAAIESQWGVGSPKLPEGKDTVEVTAANATHLSTTKALEVKLDRLPAHNLEVNGLPGNNEIGDGTYKLKASATDGSGTISSSGVASIAITIDGVAFGTPRGSCSVASGPCTATGEWTISGGEFAVGQHALVVTATDNAGNKSSQEVALFVSRPVSPVAVGPGSVNPESGELTLKSSDVSIGGPGGALTVSREYGSEHLTAGAEGPLGGDWTLNLGGAQSLTKLATGSVLLTDGGGLQSLFTPTTGGNYAAPKGDENLKLTETTVAGKVQFQLADDSGQLTTFTLPSGGTGNTWVPTTESGPNNTNVSTFSYQTVGGITEPTEELASVAANVSCTSSLVRGCRALKFVYASSTTATGEGSSQWGDYTGRLKQVTFTAWDPSSSAMTTTAVAQYAYDKLGRLRSEWDPRVSPAVKTSVGYDPLNRVTSVLPAGEQPWLFTYGSGVGDVRTGHLLHVTRPAPTTAAGSGLTPTNTATPTISETAPVEGTKLTVSTGTWSNTPLAYAYQWLECHTVAEGEVCEPIAGATNPEYVPVYRALNRRLSVQVSAINANGAGTATTAVTGTIESNTYMEKTLEFATKGTGNGQLSSPFGIATDSTGNVWVSDTGNNRIEKFSSAGAFIATYGSGQMSIPRGIAIVQSTGYVFVADTGNARIDVFTSAGASAGSMSLASTPLAVATARVSAGQYLYVAQANNQIAVYQVTGPALGLVSYFGATGSGNGQFNVPSGLAVAEAGSRLFVADNGNHRVQELAINGGALTYASQFGSSGTGQGQFSAPDGVALQSDNVFVADPTSSRVQKFQQAGRYRDVYPGTGATSVATYPQLTNGSMYSLLTSTGKIAKWTAATRPAFVPAAPSVGSSAVWTLEYGVPVSGSGAPYSLSSTEAAKWGQTDNPVEAMAVLPPDSPQGWPASSYARATVYYLDAAGHTVNVATPGGGVSTTEFNAKNDVVRSLGADARKTALVAGGTSAEVAKTLDSQSSYSEDGSEMLSTTGPQHTVKLSNGTQVLARHRTKYFYDEGAPGTGGPYHLVTKMTEGALLTGGTEEDVHTTTTSYAGQEGLGWKLHEPTSITTDPSGLKLVRTKLYEAATGYVTDEISPGGNQAGGDSHDNQTVYYTALANAKVAACGLHPEFANLPCQAKLAKQPETAGIPNPPVVTQTYNLWDEALETTGMVGTESRKVTDTYDVAGRLHTTAVASSTGTALPVTTFGYDSTSGKLATSSATEGTTTRTITNGYDKWGELTGYTDADGVLSEYTYDVDGRPLTSKDGKGGQTYSYDPATGLPSSLVDTAVGTITATYDVEGKPLTQVYPNGMTAKYAYDATGQATGLEYVKTTECASNCTWFSDSVVPSITGQWLSQSSSLSSQSYKYDSAARLTQVQDTPAAGGCTTRLYGFDGDGNRTSQTTRSPGTGGVCAAEGGTVVSHTYDPADRLIDTGATYDAFGDTTSLPAGDAGGTVLSSSYYTNGAVASQTQNGQTNGYHLDPDGRQREVVATGHTTLTSVEHYDSAVDAPSWVAEGTTGWTRNVQGIVGGLVATQTNGEAPVLRIENLHGDIVGTASMSTTATALTSTSDTSEYGVPRTATPPKYSWLGASERATTLASGVVAMGARSYVPQIGRFLQSDPVPGGSANAYSYTSGDPVNESDPSGESSTGLSGWLTEVNNGIAQQVVVREAQREAAARAEAEAAAAAAAEAAAASAGEYESGPGAEGEVEEELGEELDEGEWEAGEIDEWVLGPAGSLTGRLSGLQMGLFEEVVKAGKIIQKGEHAVKKVVKKAKHIANKVRCGIIEIVQVTVSHTPKGEAIIKEEHMKPRKFKGCPKYQTKE
jgi:RHS repeat-associated protein